MGRQGVGVAALAVAATLGWAPSGHAQRQGPYVDWPALLPALPAPFTPNVEPDCADGADACIDRTIMEMRRRLNAVVPACDHRAVFSLAYLRVTEDVRDAVRAGEFQDPRWLNSEDAVFARLYFSVYDAYEAGRREGIPVAWQLAFDTEKARELSALGDFLMSMNAHINRDMPFVLAGIGITRPDGPTRKGDHDLYNKRLANLYTPVLKEVAQRFDPTADDVEIGPVDDVLAAAILQSWREGVWRNAERLVNARSAAERAQVAASIEAYAEGVGRVIRSLTQADPAARDAWCAAHGGQDPALVAGVVPAQVGGTARPGSARITARALRTSTRARGVRIPLACPATAGDCRGRILVRLPHGGPLLRSVAYAVASGTSRTVTIDLRAPQRRQARRVRTIRITLARAGVTGKGARTSRMVRVR
jgi:hypothetical protein